MNVRIAIPYSDGNVFPHFGKSTQFKLYTIANDALVSSEVVETGGVGHEELGLWLVRHEVNAVICGNVGPGAQGALMAAGIHLLAGVEGPADEAVEKLLAGQLEAVSAATCGCSGHGHGGGCHGGGCHGGGCHGGGCCH